ncbi:potassium channel family protein [Ammoniphilus sp. CFH 90114]|uniref:potassium channel family protein n=1 Tax=Ammoniphilus sp. CFH 90114 TaxID=2493665 RepID=UPI00100E4218|nr:potassium channel family protein [Ammoniphilus sp. CFH 90114]RXT15256.1 two pore domain potassium channel family protein [Ammoniphilus sp. CFH 90114]
MHRSRVLLYQIISLFLFYLNIILSFALIYTTMDITQIGPIVDHYASSTHQEPWLDRFTRSFYFSAITLLSVGYGDVTPMGWSKAIAVIQALIGYILPAALVIKYIIFPSDSIKRWLQEKEQSKNTHLPS